MATERVIIRKKTRILTPLLYDTLIGELNTEYQIICAAALHTGMRLVELWALRDHPEWYHANEHVIDLPAAGAAKKHEMLTQDRTVRLSREGCEAVEVFLKAKPAEKDYDAFGNALKRAAVRAGIDTAGIVPKMFRKTLISWLMECRSELHIDAVDIAASAGHDIRTMMAHYLGFGFTKEAKVRMIMRLEGWK